jgi:NAD(P)-dependent dehydrogenase (short-subunit alcohol dehydrogenase family)
VPADLSGQAEVERALATIGAEAGDVDVLVSSEVVDLN